jgi:hypothetical protein
MQAGDESIIIIVPTASFAIEFVRWLPECKPVSRSPANTIRNVDVVVAQPAKVIQAAVSILLRRQNRTTLYCCLLLVQLAAPRSWCPEQKAEVAGKRLNADSYLSKSCVRNVAQIFVGKHSGSLRSHRYACFAANHIQAAISSASVLLGCTSVTRTHTQAAAAYRPETTRPQNFHHRPGHCRKGIAFTGTSVCGPDHATALHTSSRCPDAAIEKDNHHGRICQQQVRLYRSTSVHNAKRIDDTPDRTSTAPA